MCDVLKRCTMMDFANPMRGAVHDPGTLFTSIASVFKGASFGEVLAAGGSVVSAAGQIAAGKNQSAIANYQAQQLEQQAKAERAAASLEAENEAKQKRLVQSRARAVAAASGGGQDIGLLGDIEEEGTYRQMLAIWGGEERAKGRQAQAAAARFEGKAYKRAGFLEGAKTILGGGSSFMERYG